MQATPMRIPVTCAALILMVVATPLFGQIESRTGRDRMALPPTVAAALTGPIITAVSDGTAGTYIDIRGSGFGEVRAGDGGVPREVHFVMNGQDIKTQSFNYWHDNQIRAVVPTFPTAIVPGRADVYVVTASGAKSAPQPILYTPAYGTRVYCLKSSPPGTTIIKPGGLHQATVWPASSVDRPDCVPNRSVHHRNIGLSGSSGNDWFFMGVRLTNGWVVENVILGVYHAQQAGAVIASSGKGSNDVVTNVRWWADVGSLVGVTYTLAVVIKGPVQLPDGWLVR